ncbi:MAG: lytic transglycosylase domain-containing protein [Lachnospiraceae bacterium]|nr:lytic transglycosylase domain-containing protein [Lachnospiraceae bacterium]
MHHDIDRRRRENLRRKRQRARQIRRRVCSAVVAVICMVTGVVMCMTRTTRQAAAADVSVWVEMGVAMVDVSGASGFLQDRGTPDEAVAAVPREPAFVCLPVPMDEDEQRIVFDICMDNGIAFSFVMAVIGKESGFEREAHSTAGDNGYMQINDCNAAAMAERGFTDMYDTAQNVGAGVSILCDLFDIYGDDEVHRVLMAYNMGKGNAAKLWQQGIETSAYSREIVEKEAEYSRYMDGDMKGY